MPHPARAAGSPVTGPTAMVGETTEASAVQKVIVIGGRGQPYGAWAVIWTPGQSTFNVHLSIYMMIDPQPSKVFTHYGENNNQPPTLAQAVNIMAEWLAIGELEPDR